MAQKNVAVMDEDDVQVREQRKGFLARWLGEERAIQSIESQTMCALARIQAKGAVQKQMIKTAAEVDMYEYQLALTLEVAKHRAELKTRNAKILDKIAADFDLDVKVQDFLKDIEDLDLDILQEVQHQQNARKTARREKVRDRMHRR